MNTWIVCGNQSGAKIFNCNDVRNGLQLVANHPHPDGRLKEHDLVSDHSGSKNLSIGLGHGTNAKESAKIALIDQFVKQISQEIDRGYDAQAFDAIIVCADPKFLGKLRNQMSARAQKRIVGSLSENFYNADLDFVFQEVKNLIIEANSQFKLNAS